MAEKNKSDKGKRPSDLWRSWRRKRRMGPGSASIDRLNADEDAAKALEGSSPFAGELAFER